MPESGGIVDPVRVARNLAAAVAAAGLDDPRYGLAEALDAVAALPDNAPSSTAHLEMPCERHHDGFDCHQRKCSECFA